MGTARSSGKAKLAPGPVAIAGSKQRGDTSRQPPTAEELEEQRQQMLVSGVERSDGASEPRQRVPVWWPQLALVLAVAMASFNAGLSRERPLPVSAFVESKSGLFVGQADHALERDHYRVEDITLPTSGYEETHEVYYDATTHTAYLSQIVSSRLLQIGFVGTRLANSARAWTAGRNSSGLHNVQGSASRPGMLWLTLQYDDSVYLVDPSRGLRTVYEMRCPTSLGSAQVGGPHSAAEAADGSLWVGLKASNLDDDGDAKVGLTAADQPSKAWAVWHVHPERYDPSLPAHGGTLYEARKSPTMIATDGGGNAFISLDASEVIMRVSAAGEASFIRMPPGYEGMGSGPGVAADGAGNVWVCALRSTDGTLIRFAAGSSTPEVVRVLPEPGCNGIGCVGFDASDAERHVIHMAFSGTAGRSRTAKVLYVLTTSLLAGNADEAVFAIELEDDWRTLRPHGEVGTQQVWLPEDHSAAHRLAVVQPDASLPVSAEYNEPSSLMGGNAILVTGLHLNQVFYIRGYSL